MLKSLLAIDMNKLAMLKAPTAWDKVEGLVVVGIAKVGELRVPIGYFSSDSAAVELSARVTTTGEDKTTSLEWYVMSMPNKKM